jgi:hypothetical protein
MRLASVSTLTALAFAIVAPISWQARAGSEEVKFPESHTDGVHYATVERGNIKEDIFTSHATIEAVKAGQPIPSGTVITLVDYRDGKLVRYVVMEKRVAWGQGYPPKSATANGSSRRSTPTNRSIRTKISTAASHVTRVSRSRTLSTRWVA